MTVSFIFFLYVLLVLFLVVGWDKAVVSKQLKGPDITSPRITVLVPVRNEEDRIHHLIEDLRQQSIQDIEVIIIDDHSVDRTREVCEAAINGDVRFHVSKATGHGKKLALTQGVKAASGVLIATTDADCRVGPLWLKELTREFSDPTAMMIFGGVRFAGHSWFESVQAMEFAALIGVGGSSAAWHLPTMCNGASLAYRKIAFEHVGGYNDNIQIPSGDDEFLMRKVNAAFSNSVRFCSAKDAVVVTRASNSIRALFYQRVRWAGKWRHDRNVTSGLLAPIIFAFHAAVVSLPYLVVTGMVQPSIAATALLSKALVECFFLRKLRITLRFNWSWSGFAVLQLIYSYYVIIVAICAQFMAFEWKGRRMKSTVSGTQPLV